MPTIKSFFANIQSYRDNGATIELNLRGDCYIDHGKHSGPPEDCYEAESEINIRSCLIIWQHPNGRWFNRKVDFYQYFTIAEQSRFLDAAICEMENDF